MPEPTATAVPRPPAERRAPQPLDFPGCHPMRIPREEIAACDIRFEYWDADTEIAMVCEPVSYYHERPAQRLAKLAERIAAARGVPIEAVGHTDLLVRNARGERHRIMQADQILFLRPAQTIPQGKAIEVGIDPLPDVVLEVDNTTDVRRRKLGLYESWGFPEVWVEVPDAPEPNRPESLRPGLTIHLLERGRFRPALASRSFPGWTAQEIHRALERAGAVRADRRGVGPAGTYAGSGGRHGAGRRSARAPLAQGESRRGVGRRTCHGSRRSASRECTEDTRSARHPRSGVPVGATGRDRDRTRASGRCGVGVPGRGGLSALLPVVGAFDYRTSR